MENIITTPKGGNKVELKEYITGRDSRTLREALIKAAVIDPSGRGVKSIDAVAMNASDDKKITVAVISVDGVTENIVNTILDMPQVDYEFVMDAVDALTGGLDKKKEN